MKFDAVIVGSGVAGLTAAAYLSRGGCSIALCEKEASCGGLVRTFERGGFKYDGGIRAFENSGIFFPMLKQLGIPLELVRNEVTLGIEDQVIHLDTPDSVYAYKKLLTDMYPASKQEIEEITQQIVKIMHYMEVQYGIDNPLFLDVKEDRDYFIKKVFPWMFKYAITSPKIAVLNEPVVDYLKHYTNNQSLLDIITQHFFQETPAFFALSYLKLYLDYYYPVGGTGKLIEKLVALIRQHGGEIKTNTNINMVDPVQQTLTTSGGEKLEYKRLVWAADLKTLYDLVDPNQFTDEKVQRSVAQRKAVLADAGGCDSVFTLFAAVDIEPEYFSKIASAHFFYTPSRVGQSEAGPVPLGKTRKEIEKWLEDFFALTTYEISIPVLRDSQMAPAGKTGLIISMLFDYQLTHFIQEAGWYEEFKQFSQRCILQTLDNSIFPGIRSHVLDQFSSSPLTMQRLAGTLDGAITGWAFTNHPMPAENRLPHVANSIKTPIPHILQAGQWTFSPSGFPTALLSGKMAADKVMKEIKRKNKHR